MTIAKTTRPHLLTREAAAARIEALEAALHEIEGKLLSLNTRWALEGGPFDGSWVSEVMAAHVNQQKSE